MTTIDDRIDDDDDDRMIIDDVLMMIDKDLRLVGRPTKNKYGREPDHPQSENTNVKTSEKANAKTRTVQHKFDVTALA